VAVDAQTLAGVVVVEGGTDGEVDDGRVQEQDAVAHTQAAAGILKYEHKGKCHEMYHWPGYGSKS
jgi:hypothetical protein